MHTRRLNYSNFHPNGVARIMVSAADTFTSKNRERKVKMATGKLFPSPRFLIDRKTSTKAYLPSILSLRKKKSAFLLHFALQRIKKETNFFLLYARNFHSIFLLSFPFQPTEFYCFRHELSQVEHFFSKVRLSYILQLHLSLHGKGFINVHLSK